MRTDQIAALSAPQALVSGSGEATNRATLGDQRILWEFTLKDIIKKTMSYFKKYVLTPINNLNELFGLDYSKVFSSIDVHGGVTFAGVGFDAFVADKFSKGTRRGFLGYFQIIANEYLHYIPEKYKITFEDGQIITEKALFIAFANSNQFGYDTTIAPNATLVDGLLDVCIVKKPQIYRIPLVASLLLLRRVDFSPLVKIVNAKSLVVSCKQDTIVNIDGEAINFGKELDIKIIPLSLKIIINRNVSKV
jgi:diacylglycerol kinase family enzyme